MRHTIRTDRSGNVTIENKMIFRNAREITGDDGRLGRSVRADPVRHTSLEHIW
jgi:hypothetical protein